MTDAQLLDALRKLSVETGSLACLGCGWEHNCSTSGCRILRLASDALAIRQLVSADLAAQTNADHIRSMDDAALSRLLTYGDGGFDCSRCSGLGPCELDCDTKCLDWLRAPRKDDKQNDD